MSEQQQEEHYYNNNEGTVFAAVISALVGVAATAVFALTIMQSDVVSRRLLLTPKKLATKRLSSYQYAWYQALLQQIKLYYRATDPIRDIRYPTITELLTLTTTEEIQELIARILSRKLANLRVARIGRDDEATFVDSKEYFVWVHVTFRPQRHCGFIFQCNCASSARGLWHGAGRRTRTASHRRDAVWRPNAWSI
jgi:hypothetical protein